MTWFRLLTTEAGRICAPMFTQAPRLIAALAISSLLAAPAMAVDAGKPPTAKPPTAKPAPQHTPAPATTSGGPKQIGKFEDWIAATHQESGATVCYAFTRALVSAPAIAGRGQVIITITQRPSLRDAVAMEAGFAYADKAAVTVQVDQSALDFYTDKRNAFARDGKAVAAAFAKGAKAIAKSPGPKGVAVQDTFSLKGFSDAYKAITKACPPK
jgi:hypothetical protein